LAASTGSTDDPTEHDLLPPGTRCGQRRWCAARRSAVAGRACSRPT